jgi:hypothetical protein
MFPVEAFQDTVGKLAGILDSLGIRFHLTGGVTSVLYGEPRLTQDIDLVVDPVALTEQLDVFLSTAVRCGYLLEADTVRAAVSRRGMFQLFDQREALKLDLYAREMIPGELNRSSRVELFVGMELPVVSRVDAAVSKLIWISKGSHKSRGDFRQIMRLATELDCAQIVASAQQLGLKGLLETVLSESDQIE